MRNALRHLRGESQKNIVRLIDGLSGKYSHWDIWQDFIVMSAIAIANATGGPYVKEREAMYRDRACKYSAKELEAFSDMLFEVIAELERDPDQDFLGEIQGALARAGATKIMVDYESGKPTAVTFAIETAAGMRGFRLPAAVDGTLRVFTAQRIKADRDQAERTAWRNIRDWVLAQLALVESCDIAVDEVFFPYLTDKSGKTLYQVYAAGQLMLEESNEAY